jgi:hypothetical protein
MDYVQAQPGEAVLDWPFCVSGANSPIPRNALCPSYAANSGVYALRRFHEKKVMGQYLGRMDPKQAQPYLDAGWDELLSPEPSRRGPDGVRRRQIHCFRAQEWQFFREFYERNDFAGINLYVDLLPPGCPAKFYLRFGLPAQQTYVPGAGRVEFLRKTEEQRSRVDKERGKALRFEGIKG